MSILSLFRAVSGQKSKKRNIAGIEISYCYTGKPVLFDPIAMLRELKYKMEINQQLPGELCVGLGDIDDPNLSISDKLIPTVVAKFTIDDESLRVERSVKTTEKVPCSRYEFFHNQIPICSFQRIYDYGKGFACKKEIVSQYINEKNTSNPHYWKNNQNEGLFLEHFGHTHFWVLNSISGLERVFSKIGN